MGGTSLGRGDFKAILDSIVISSKAVAVAMKKQAEGLMAISDEMKVTNRLQAVKFKGMGKMANYLNSEADQTLEESDDEDVDEPESKKRRRVD